MCERRFAKNFLVPGEIPLAARSHRFFGNTLLKAGHLMRPSVVSGTVRGLALQGGQGLAAPIQNDSGLPQKCRTQAFASTCAVEASHLAPLATKDFSRKCRKRQSSFDAALSHRAAPLRRCSPLFTTTPRVRLACRRRRQTRILLYSGMLALADFRACPLCHLRATAPDRRRALELPASWRGRALSRHCPAVKREAEEEWGKER